MSAAKFPRRNLHHFSSLLILCFLFSSANSDELKLLLDIKGALQNPNTNIFDSWESNNSICSFHGISCNQQNTSVIGIELSYQNLTGSIPFDSICQLRSLRKLSLGFNSLTGVVAKTLNDCSGLNYLDLGNNFFSGEFPDISSMSQLMYLHLNNSGFSGNFPWKFLGNMSGLVVLSVGDNPGLDRTLFPAEVLNLVKLDWLYLSNCSIEGKIPAGIGNLTQLKNLELSTNYMSGEIPAEIGNLVNLWQLELFSNGFTGKLPAMRNLTRLENFDASDNNLEGDISELRYLPQLVSLQLFDNGFSGVLPPEFGEFRHLVNLSLYRNNFTGTLPEKLGSWSDFNFIDISENFLTGNIPPDMCKSGTMTELLMLDNEFTGQIPASYASCMTLTRFRVSRNKLTGIVPGGIWGLPEVNIIDIEWNMLEGSITPDIQNAKKLGQIFAANNRLSSELPAEIYKASSLYLIDLSHNQLSGQVPATIGQLNQLSRLDLEDNRFTGSIPESLGSCDSLSDMNMARNSLSGQIPVALGRLRILNFLNLSSNQLSGEIPSSLSVLKLSLLDLSHNKLVGAIPESLSIEAYNGSFAGNDGLCSQKVTYFRRCASSSGMTPEIRTLISCFAVASAIILVSVACFVYSRKSRKDVDQERSLKSHDSWNVKSFHLLSFTEDDILDSIKPENEIGKGGSGIVYKVTLQKGLELAVKHIWNSVPSGKKKSETLPMLRKHFTNKRLLEFDAEVETLSSIRHVNVVKLYCSITSEDSNLLVYEYLPNGSLWDRLHNSAKKLGLDWDTRYEIALGAAKGLEYLHHGCERPVLHRDVKSSNILLDEFLKPRIADFGLAKIVQSDTSDDSTHIIAGTHGYIAPEYGYTYRVNEKSDVYSFGVVLMELVTGKRPIEAEYGDNKDIVNWVCSMLKDKESVLSLVDSCIKEPYIKEEAIKVLKIAIQCTTRLPALRPTMRTVVQMLEEAEPCKLVRVIISKDSDDKKPESI